MVTNAIQKKNTFLPGEKITIKRKFKVTPGGATKKWWFVVRGSKCDIDLLEKEWPIVTLQTGWKLEPLVCFEEDAATSCPVFAQQPPNQNTQNTQMAANGNPTPTPTLTSPTPPVDCEASLTLTQITQMVADHPQSNFNLSDPTCRL